MIINIQISILNCLHFGTSKKYFLLYMDFRSGIWSSTTGISTTDRNKVLRHILKPSWWALQSQGDQIVDINLMIKSFLLQKRQHAEKCISLNKVDRFYYFQILDLHGCTILTLNEMMWNGLVIGIVLEICNQYTRVKSFIWHIFLKLYVETVQKYLVKTQVHENLNANRK